MCRTIGTVIAIPLKQVQRTTPMQFDGKSVEEATEGRVARVTNGFSETPKPGSIAFSWREYRPERDRVPPPPGLPPVSTLNKAHPVHRRMPMALAVVAALYVVFAAVWFLTH